MNNFNFVKKGVSGICISDLYLSKLWYNAANLEKKPEADLSLFLMILHLSGMQTTQFKDVVLNFIIIYKTKHRLSPILQRAFPLS